MSSLTIARRLGGSLASAAGYVLRAAGDIVYPACCLACRTATASRDGLCARCWAAVRFIEPPFCQRLGTPFGVDHETPGLLSPEAIAHPPVFSRARAVARFDDGPSRRLVHRLKYGDRLELAGTMGKWMARAGAELLTEADLLVPVPLHRRRLAARRFNQSALLARAIGRSCGVPTAMTVLVRRKATASQVGLSRTQRQINLQGAFAVAPEARAAVAGRAIVLVDDVLTSGATVNAASRALLRAGARRVDVLVFARVVAGG